MAAGEPHAMNECITRYGDLVWSIVGRRIDNPGEAEDLVQEIFTEIWKKAGSFNPQIASESTFVGMVARRRSIDFLRQRGRQPGFENIAAAESLPQPETQVSAVVCDPEIIRSSVAELPLDTRQLFELFFDRGFTHPEIAERTGIPLGTVKTKLRRGIIAIRDRIRQVRVFNNPAAS